MTHQNDSYCLTDTIYALASGAGAAGVAVIRVSGPRVRDVLKQLSGVSDPVARHAYFKTLVNQKGMPLDQALVLFFEKPNSFTGEDIVEFQVHGGRQVIRSILESLGNIDGCRPAERGEFTRRAVLNGKMDLTQAEGLLDVIHAETSAQQAQAFRQMNGTLKDLYESWRTLLKKHMAYLEAFIDFPEEEVSPQIVAQIDKDISELAGQIRGHLDDGRAGQKLREGFYIVLAGAPNVGKSSLMNAFVQKDMAIVSKTAGTTRDIIEAHLDLAGFPVVLADTAGLREEAGEIEYEGIRRALARAKEADLVLNVQDAAHYPSKVALPQELVGQDIIEVWNKTDLHRVPDYVCGVSAQTNEGIDALRACIRQKVEKRFSGNVFITRERYRVALGECLLALERAAHTLETELKAEELRLAARAIGRITGRIENEELLDIIFRDFCIGK